MTTKSISSSEVQNNFGTILDDVVQNGTRYVVKRRKASLAIVLAIADFDRILASRSERARLRSVIRELAPEYGIGEVIEES